MPAPRCSRPNVRPPLNLLLLRRVAQAMRAASKFVAGLIADRDARYLPRLPPLILGENIGVEVSAFVVVADAHVCVIVCGEKRPYRQRFGG